MEATISLNNVGLLIGRTLEYDRRVEYSHRTIASGGTTITITLRTINLEVGEYGGVNAALVGEDGDGREITLRLPLEGLNALLQNSAYCRMTTADQLTENESFTENSYEIID